MFAFYLAGPDVPASGPLWALVSELGQAVLATRTTGGQWQFRGLDLAAPHPRYGETCGCTWAEALARMEADQPWLLRLPRVDASAQEMLRAWRAQTDDPSPVAFARIPDEHLEGEGDDL